MARVFISHASQDLWVARQIAAEIGALGAETFLDVADIAHGDDSEEEILKAEPGCSELLVLLTPWSLKRPWIWLEIDFFRHSRKRIVCVLYGISAREVASDPDVASVVKKLDMVELNDLDSYLGQLKQRIGS
jgi:hypothetical protein